MFYNDASKSGRLDNRMHFAINTYTIHQQE